MATEPTNKQQHLEGRATAFVFGEMNRDEATQFMKEMKDSTSLQSLVASIREAVGAVEAELNSEALGLNPLDLEKVADAIESKHIEAPPLVDVADERSARRWATALAIAATLLLVCGMTLPALNQVIATKANQRELLDEIDRKEQIIERLVNEKSKVQRELVEVRSELQDRIVASEKMMHEAVANSDANLATEQSGSPGSHDHPVDATSVTDASVAATMPSSIPPGGQDEFSPSESGESDRESNSLLTNSGSNSDAPTITDIAADRHQDGASNPLSEAANPTGPKEFDSVARIPQSVLGQAHGRSPRGIPTKRVFGLGPDSNRVDIDMLVALGNDQSSVGDNTKSFESTKAGDTANMLASGDRFAQINDNPFSSVIERPVSVFPARVDQSSYSKVRMYLNQYDQLPPVNAIRIEELVNFFDYHYEPPQDDALFAAALDVSECPWNPSHRLARIAVKGREHFDQRPSSNLVFLIDVSGSMNRPNKLPLVIDGIKNLANQLGEQDSIAMVVYGGAAGTVLEPTSGDRKKLIHDALDRLKQGGETIDGKGIDLAYQLAREQFVEGGINQVVICSDGNLTAGISESESLVDTVAGNAEDQIMLTVLGFGAEHRTSDLMDEIREKGKANLVIFSDRNQAQRDMVKALHGTEAIIANHVDLQVEFNPVQVQAYRLIGYENRMLVSGGDANASDTEGVPAGCMITALYEIVPRIERDDAIHPKATSLKYQQPLRYSPQADSDELLTLGLTYDLPMANKRESMEFVISDNEKSVEMTDGDFQFSAAVAAFGMLLRDSPYKGNASLEMVLELAFSGAVDDRSGYRDEFVSLVQKAQQIAGGD